MAELTHALTQVRDRIVKFRDSRAMNEENTKATLVEPVLRALGWDVEDVEEVRREFKRKRSDKPVDYALMLLRAPRLFVEAKALGQDLGERKWANQIMGYASVAGVEWVVLTNGDEYRIYNSHATVAVEEKLFRTLRVSEEPICAEDTLRLLSKEQLRENRIEVLWNAFFIDRQVRNVVEQLFGDEIDPSLVRLISKRVPKLATKDVKASLLRAHVTLDFPVEPEAETRRPATAKNGSRSERSRGVRSDVSLNDLIRAGILKPPLPIEKRYKGHSLTARVTQSGQVEYQGRTYDSLSQSASAARVSIIGRRPDGSMPATNGWTFWHFRDEHGNARPIEMLRRRLLAGDVSVIPIDVKRNSP